MNNEPLKPYLNSINFPLFYFKRFHENQPFLASHFNTIPVTVSSDGEVERVSKCYDL